MELRRKRTAVQTEKAAVSSSPEESEIDEEVEWIPAQDAPEPRPRRSARGHKPPEVTSASESEDDEAQDVVDEVEMTVDSGLEEDNGDDELVEEREFYPTPRKVRNRTYVKGSAPALKSENRLATRTKLEPEELVRVTKLAAESVAKGTRPGSMRDPLVKQKKASKKGRRRKKEEDISATPPPSDKESEYDSEDGDPEAAVRRVLTEHADAPPGMLMDLLPFQKLSLHWMKAQELETEYMGGILADEMGMGKTIQALSLIMANRRQIQDTPLPSVGRVAKTTLIVCPLVALIQWKAEIERFTKAGSLKYLIYHGPDRTLDIDELASYDVVMTTYSIIQSEYRKRTGVYKESCIYCHKKYYPDKLIVHHRYFCGPNAKKTAKQAKQEKHVEQPKKEDEITPDHVSKKPRTKGNHDDSEEMHPKAMTDSLFGALRKTSEKAVSPPSRWKGRKRKSSGETRKAKSAAKKEENLLPGEEKDGSEGDEGESDQDTGVYGTGLTWMEYAKECAKARYGLRDDYKNREAENMAESPLHNITWHRIVLDEAHAIKDRSCSTAKAIFALNAEFRWALSGTPLQNRVSELYSIVRFLRVDPYAYYFDKKGNCKSLNWDFNPETRRCEECDGTRMSHYCWWNKHIANPIKRDGHGGEGKKAMRVLRTHVLGNILLRRTKDTCKDISLPSKTIRMRREKLSDAEDDFYKSLYQETQAKFDTYVQSGTVLNNYGHIFSLLLRLRQAVLHPYLVTHSETAFKLQEKAGIEHALHCMLCGEEASDPIAASCKDIFCRHCITDLVSSFDYTAGVVQGCPSCSQPLSIDLTKDAIQQRISRPRGILARIGDLSSFQTSTKLDALMDEIDGLRASGEKAIVFSQFVNFLDIIEHKLKSEKVSCVKLDGRMSVDRRERFIKDFMENPDTKIFLMSLKAGGVALNLTAASRVFIMDPWWNPAAEFQAMDRIHRLGQKKEVVVTRIVVEDSIEDRVLSLQAKKKLVFEATVGDNQTAAHQLTEGDMRFLFA